MTEHKSEYIKSVVEKVGKSADRVRAVNTTFTTSRRLSESCGVECKSGRDTLLPNAISQWLALIARLRSTEDDVEHLTAVCTHAFESYIGI
jgi:hypothetical protein